MIFDKIEYAGHYFGIYEKLTKGLHFLCAFDKNKFKLGSKEDLGDGIFVLFQERETYPEKERKYEAHKKYIDIQYVLEGDEIITYRDIKGMPVKIPYDSDKDIMFFDGSAPGSPLLMTPGYFAIFFPHDAHKPLVTYQSNSVRKIVLKIPYE
jgi:YhcH/YjgK/YiaL family protein